MGAALPRRALASSPTRANKENWQRVNLKIKFRESFRPFAPACLAEKAAEWFDIDRESPYMLLVCQVPRAATCRRSRTWTARRACRP